MRKIALAAGVAALSLFACTALTSVAMADPIKAKVAVTVPGEDTHGQALYRFKENLEKTVPGMFELEIFPGSSLFKQTQQVQALTRGNLEISYINMFDVAAKIPEASILTAGYTIRDIDHNCAVLKSDFGQDVLRQIEEKYGIKVIGQVLVGARTLVLREARDVTKPEDIADLTMREIGTESWQFLAEALGAKPTPIAYSELYLALQTGTVDAFAGYPGSMISTKFYEVTEQMVLTNHSLSVQMLAVSSKWWDGLSEDEQSALRDAATPAMEYGTELRLKADADAIGELRELGFKVTEPDTKPFQEHMQAKYLASKFAENWPEGLMEKITALPSDPTCQL